MCFVLTQMHRLCCAGIRAFRNAHTARATDNELALLTTYLLDIAELEDLRRVRMHACARTMRAFASVLVDSGLTCPVLCCCSGLDHRRWESYRSRR
jgi:hypothetical protein